MIVIFLVVDVVLSPFALLFLILSGQRVFTSFAKRYIVESPKNRYDDEDSNEKGDEVEDIFDNGDSITWLRLLFEDK